MESQQEEAQRKPSVTGASSEPPELMARRKTLELARARARADLEAARAPAHRQMLEQAIKALDDQLAKLGTKA